MTKEAKENKKLEQSARAFGWGTWIRTTINGSKDRCPAVRRFPSAEGQVRTTGESLTPFMAFGQGCSRLRGMNPSSDNILPHIIFAEDNPDHAFLIRRVLELHCVLTYASDGEQLLEILESWMDELPRLVML